MLLPFTAVLAFCATLTHAVQPIEIRGAHFVNSVTGKRFQLLGIAYQPGGQSGFIPGVVDPLSKADVCLRDAALMQRLGVNSIRVYNLDPDLNHDECASIFNSVGIYMLLDVNSPVTGGSINRAEPWTSYYAGYLNRTFAVVEAFKNYPNTALFFSGNEIINDVETGATAPPYIRAVTRDMKIYIKKHVNRPIPVGYSAADVRESLLDQWQYTQCTTTGDASDPSRVDLFALNSYSWCGHSSYQASGYDALVENFAKTSVPVFFSEYGCNEPSPRVFDEVPFLYGPLMTPVLSGGLIYEYSQEPSNYGLVEIDSKGNVQLRSDYDSLQRQFKTLNITALEGMTAKNSSVIPPTCSPSIIKNPKFNKDFTIPAVPPGAQEMIDNGIKNAPVGKLVPVTKTKVPQTVKASNGDIIEGLEIRVLKDGESNTPGDTAPESSPSRSSSPLSATTSSPPAATTTPGAAANIQTSLAVLFGAVFLATCTLML